MKVIMGEKTELQLNEMIDEIREKYTKEKIIEYWSAEEKPVRNAIAAILKTDNMHNYFAKSALGVGGSGIVIRMGDKLFPKIDKALKFPRPIPGKVELIAEMLEKEITYLSDLNHEGIVRINHYDTIQNVGEYNNLPYYLMDYVEGISPQNFLKKSKNMDEDFHTLVKGTAYLILHLHKCPPDGFAHLDIKPENILIKTDCQPVMIDLGTCKRLRNDQKHTIVACTRSLAHPQLIQRLEDDPSDENRARGTLKHSEINPEWDLWSFGLTILKWLGVDKDEGSLVTKSVHSRLSPYNRKYYMLLVARMLTYSLPEWLCKRVGLSSNFLKEFKIESAEEVCDILSRLDGTSYPLHWISQTENREYGTIQAGPDIHVPFTPALRLTMEHRLFRRLNSITQLGVASQVYPAAKHTRREHSLGTYANTISFLKSLYNDPLSPLFRQIVTEEDSRDILLTSLLHDIGQFPLAHDLEEIDRRIFDHGELTQAMLKGKWQKKKAGSQTIIFESLNPVFQAWQSSSERVLKIPAAKSTNSSSSLKSKLMRSIISGPIDADKLDYLSRDARHTDLPYPSGIDVDMLLRCLTTVVIPSGPGYGQDIPTIGVHAKGRVAAEFLTFARYAMFSQVYWHHVVRCQKAMLLRAVEALLAQYTRDRDLMKFKSDFLGMVTLLPESLYKA